jgi:hypothetical protein
MDMQSYIQHKPVSEGPVRLDSLKEYDFFRKSPDGPIIRRLFKHGDKIATLNTRTLKVLMLDPEESVFEIIVTSVDLKIQIVDFPCKSK